MLRRPCFPSAVTHANPSLLLLPLPVPLFPRLLSLCFPFVAEAINTEGIMSAYEWCIAQGILRVHQVGNTRMLQLTPDYQQPPGQRTRTTSEAGQAAGVARTFMWTRRATARLGPAARCEFEHWHS
jgi:hypothetical protein